MKNRLKEAQEALDFLCNHAMEYVDDFDWEENECGTYESICEDDLREYKKPLQELIDKATPKKTKYIGYDLYICQCGKSVGKHFGKNTKYCSYCGQAIDWSDDYE